MNDDTTLRSQRIQYKLGNRRDDENIDHGLGLPATVDVSYLFENASKTESEVEVFVFSSGDPIFFENNSQEAAFGQDWVTPVPYDYHYSGSYQNDMDEAYKNAEYIYALNTENDMSEWLSQKGICYTILVETRNDGGGNIPFNIDFSTDDAFAVLAEGLTPAILWQDGLNSSYLKTGLFSYSDFCGSYDYDYDVKENGAIYLTYRVFVISGEAEISLDDGSLERAESFDYETMGTTLGEFWGWRRLVRPEKFSVEKEEMSVEDWIRLDLGKTRLQDDLNYAAVENPMLTQRVYRQDIEAKAAEAKCVSSPSYNFRYENIRGASLRQFSFTIEAKQNYELRIAYQTNANWQDVEGWEPESFNYPYLLGRELTNIPVEMEIVLPDNADIELVESNVSFEKISQNHYRASAIQRTSDSLNFTVGETIEHFELVKQRKEEIKRNRLITNLMILCTCVLIIAAAIMYVLSKRKSNKHK